MKNKKGFTLLELLVVVLIIGILAAIALPQYKKAVLKSRYATMKDKVVALYNSEQRYYLVNNTYTNDVENLDIDMDFSGCNITETNIFCNLETNGRILQFIINKATGQRRCDASPGDQNSITNKICQLETGKTTPDYCDGTADCRYWY